MKATRTVLLLIVFLAAVANLVASGPVGVYAMLERVVFEPNETAPERVQLWGAFKFVEGNVQQYQSVLNTSPARRGYLYFRLPSRNESAAKAEWADLKTIAGTGEAVGFGSWGFVGSFSGVESARANSGLPYFLDTSARGNPQTEVRIRPASETPANPAPYSTNAGIVRLTDSGSHAAIVKELREALKAK